MEIGRKSKECRTSFLSTDNSKSANVPLWKLWKLDGSQFLCSGIEILSPHWLVAYGSAACIM